MPFALLGRNEMPEESEEMLREPLHWAVSNFRLHNTAHIASAMRSRAAKLEHQAMLGSSNSKPKAECRQTPQRTIADSPREPLRSPRTHQTNTEKMAVKPITGVCVFPRPRSAQ